MISCLTREIMKQRPERNYYKFSHSCDHGAMSLHTLNTYILWFNILVHHERNYH